MNVYVDVLSPCLPNKNWKYHFSCHLIADSLTGLHSFAVRLGLKTSWFQKNTIPHYDLTANKRRLAVKLGAIEIDKKQFAELLRKQRLYK